MSNVDKKPVFMVGTARDGKPVLIFGVPETAYNPVPSGHAFDFDLSSIGLPIYIQIFKGRDHSDCMSQIEAIAKAMGVPILDERRKDFSIKEPRDVTTAPKTTLTDGSPVTPDHRELRPDGQQKGYVVLSEEERAKGFVRPVRNRYVHVGPPMPSNLRELTEEESTRYAGLGYVKFEVYPPEMSPRTGRFLRQEDLDRIGKGCGTVTIMSPSLAETYARDPHFYSGTFCAGCGKHFPVGEHGEFVWDGTTEPVGT